MSSYDNYSLRFREHLTIKDDSLRMDGYSCEKLAEEYETPLYVLSENRIRHNFRNLNGELSRAYRNVLVCPAYKANSHLAVSRIYQTEGAGAEVVSPAELRIALETGVPPKKIVYNGPVKKTADLEFAISSDVGLINADSLPEIERMHEAAECVQKTCNVGIRINLGVHPDTHPHLATAQREHKFGVWIDDAVAAYENTAKWSDLSIVGMHCHIGSNITQPKVFHETAATMFKLAKQVNEKLDVQLTKIDLGGGLGFPYEANSPTLAHRDFASAILTDNKNLLEELGNPTVIFEPGRAIIADAGILLTRVEVVKKQGGVNWAIVDAGMNTFIRPVLYGAKHQVVAVNKASRLAGKSYDLGGPCCESGDIIAKDTLLAELERGDLLAVLDVGAYGFTMSSNYNGQPRPAVVLVSNGKSQLIRRREGYEDLVAGETIPPHLTIK